MNTVRKLLHEKIYIVSPPISTVFDAIAIKRVLTVIGNCLAGSRIRIEIVIYVEAVYIIPTHNVTCYLTDVFSVLRLARIKD